MKAEDKVNWLYESRGGYGYAINVAAVVIKTGSKRVQIRVAQKIDGEWRQVLKWVDPSRLSERTSVALEVDGN